MHPQAALIGRNDGLPFVLAVGCIEALLHVARLNIFRIGHYPNLEQTHRMFTAGIMF
jgi:hypothetical protein